MITRFIIFILGGIGGVLIAKEYFFSIKDKLIWKIAMARIKQPSSDFSFDPEQITHSSLGVKCLIAFIIGGTCIAFLLPWLLKRK